MKGYKVTDENMQCRGFQFTLNQWHTIDGQIKIYKKGFHWCEKLVNTFEYYCFNPKNRVFEIEAWNSGNWNSGNWNSGFFNTFTPKCVNVFNKPCELEVWLNCQKPNFIENISLTAWVSFHEMTDLEKSENPNSDESVGGYLKLIPYKDAWALAFANATFEDIQLLKKLPNWDAEVFKEITGIEVE